MPPVEVVTFAPPAAVERALRMTTALALKARLPPRGWASGRRGGGLWRWRSRAGGAVFPQARRAPGVAVVPAGPDGVLALFELHGLAAPTAPSGWRRALVWVAPDGAWTEEESVVAEGSRPRVAAPPVEGAGNPGRIKAALDLLAAPIRSRLAASRAGRWSPPAADPVAHQVSLRLHRAVREAARRRDLEALAGLERALGFVGRGHTAGESLELERLAGLPDGRFEREASRLPVAPDGWSAIEPRLGGVLLFVPA